MDRYAGALKTLGMSITGTIEMMGTTYQIATVRAGSAELKVYFSSNGTARLDKPNRTTKWVYEKSPAQLRRIAQQTLEFYTFR